MLRTLQIYTICIVVVVIILSQFTIFDKAAVANNTTVKDTKRSEVLSDLENSKYAEPLNELKSIIFSAKKSKTKFESNVKKMQRMLDIEKSVDDLFKVLE